MIPTWSNPQSRVVTRRGPCAATANIHPRTMPCVICNSAWRTKALLASESLNPVAAATDPSAVVADCAMRFEGVSSTTNCMRTAKPDEVTKIARGARHRRLVVELICLRVAATDDGVDCHVREDGM